MDDAEIKVFHNDDIAYEQWVAAHEGFVLTTPRKGEHMLHEASCSHLGRDDDAALRLTRKPRRWSQQQAPLLAWAEQSTGKRPLFCRSCQ